MRSTDTRPALNRRKLIALERCLLVAAPMIARQSALAQGGELRVANWGGDWNERVVRAFEAPFINSKASRSFMNCRIRRSARRSLAERRLPRGSVDVTWLSDADAYEMDQAGVLEPIDQSKIPNWKYIDTKLQCRTSSPDLWWHRADVQSQQGAGAEIFQ